MQTEEYVLNDQFERDWKHVKSNVERILRPLFTPYSQKLSFLARVFKSNASVWIEIREPHPSIRLLAVTLNRDVTPLTLRITTWFYDQAATDYQLWADTTGFSFNGQPLTQFRDRQPNGSWKNSPALKGKGIQVLGVEHACRELSFSDEVSLTEFISHLTKKYTISLLEVLEAEPKTYRLLGADGEFYQSFEGGALGGNSKEKRYGRLDCSAANRALAKGYENHRVFFVDEEAAIAAGYKPCGSCMREEYVRWKQGGVPGSKDYPWIYLPKN